MSFFSHLLLQSCLEPLNLNDLLSTEAITNEYNQVINQIDILNVISLKSFLNPVTNLHNSFSLE